MILISAIAGIVTGCYWLHRRTKIKKRISQKITVSESIDSAVSSVMALSGTQRFKLKRYKLEAFYAKKFVLCANHFAATLVMLFEKQGTFLLSPKSVAELSFLVPLPNSEKQVIVKAIVHHIQKTGTQKISTMITSSILVGNYANHTCAFAYLEIILETVRLKELILEAK